jgi:predicted small lipoprotein YifL
MTEPDAPARTSGAVPWKPLVVAAACLFASLAAWGQAQPMEWPPSDLMKTAAVAAAAMLFGAAIVSLLWAILQGMASTESTPAVLAPGARLGKGPYRSYSCAPDAALIEGVVASIESAAESLPPARRPEAAERLAAARRQAAAGDPREALRSVKRAIDLHVQAIRS